MSNTHEVTNQHLLDHLLEILGKDNLHIKKQLKFMGKELDDLKAAVAKETEVTKSAVVLLGGLKAKLDAAIASGDPAALTALSAELGTDTTALADAVAANTPAE